MAHGQIYLADFAVDMRKSIDGLMLLVKSEFGDSPATGAYYIFSNRKRDKLKVLYWDKSGFALWYKRLEKSCFKFRYGSGSKLQLSEDEFGWLLSGLDLHKTTGFTGLNYSVFA